MKKDELTDPEKAEEYIRETMAVIRPVEYEDEELTVDEVLDVHTRGSNVQIVYMHEGKAWLFRYEYRPQTYHHPPEADVEWYTVKNRINWLDKQIERFSGNYHSHKFKSEKERLEKYIKEE